MTVVNVEAGAVMTDVATIDSVTQKVLVDLPGNMCQLRTRKEEKALGQGRTRGADR